MSIAVGEIVEGTVTGITNFGAFVDLGENKTGLIHISEVSDAYVKDINEFLKVKDRVKVKIISVENGKVALSIKKTLPVIEKVVEQRRPMPKPIPAVSFEDKISKFIKDSDERLLDLKRHTESKRGGRGASRRG